jgi:hypothetical protein
VISLLEILTVGLLLSSHNPMFRACFQVRNSLQVARSFQGLGL